MTKLYLCTFLCLFGFTVQAQDFFMLRGYVYDELNNPLEDVEIRVRNSGLGGVTNSDGQYELRLEIGLNQLVFSSIGFSTTSIEVIMEDDEVRNIWLEYEDNQLNTVNIKRQKKDPSYRIIDSVVQHKNDWQRSYQTMKCQLYIKSVEEITSNEKKGKKNKNDEEEERLGDAAFEVETDAFDSIPNLNMFEARITRHFEQPDKIKEEREAVKKLGDQSNLIYTSSTEGDVDLYSNIFYLKSASQNALVSPFHNSTFLFYKFKFLGSYYDSSFRKIYRIRVEPRKLGNALMKGELEIYDITWQLKSAQLSLPKTALVIYDEFSFELNYNPETEQHLPVSQTFTWQAVNSGSSFDGSTKVQYSNFVYDTIYAKKFFNAEVSVTQQEAYEKDTSFWARIRPEPLTEREQDFVRRKDSIYMVINSKQYLDSLDSIYNRVTLLKLLWHGQGHINRERKETVDFSPAISLIDPVAIGGIRLRYFMSFYKKYENRKSIYLSPFLNYGFRNQDFKGTFYLNHMYNPLRRSDIDVSFGRYFDFINPYATIATIFRRDNFFEENFAGIGHSTELINGLYLGTSVNYEQRNSLASFKFSEAGDSLFENNVPVDFEHHNAFKTSIFLRYTPWQMYMREPNEKIILGSKFPTFTLSLSQAWKGVLGSATKSTYVGASVSQKFNVGIFGTSQYSIRTGIFFDTTRLEIMDYVYHRGGDPYLFTPPMYTFQMIDTTFSTFKPFVEGHYVHQFNGFIMNKIPILKKTNIKTSVGGGMLWAPERDYVYFETYAGLNRIFKIGRERLRLGVYYVASQSSKVGYRSTFKVAFEFYNRNKNTWSF